MRKMLTVLTTVTALFAGSVVIAGTAGATVSIDTFTQCLNGTGTALDCPGGWSNGAIQASNSHYREDQVVPQRLVLKASDNNNHTIKITYQARKGTIHAYDSLATWNLTQSAADPCQDLAASICAGSPTPFQMVTDTTEVPPVGAGIDDHTNFHEYPAAQRQWIVYNGAITNSTPVSHSSAAAGDDNASLTISFHATGASVVTPKTVVILFGGHLARSGTAADLRAWGPNLGASNISGGPYAISAAPVDNPNAGGKTNSIQAGAVLAGSPNFTITKSASPSVVAKPGDPVTYTITVTNNGDGPGAATFTDVYDSRLNPPLPTSTTTGGSCTRDDPNHSFTCTTVSLAASGGQQAFTYTVNMPSSFTDAPSTACTTGTNQHAVINTATLSTGGTPASATVCVPAGATFTITKSADPTTTTAGQPVTYTVIVTNTGSAPGSISFVDNYDNRLTPSAVTITPTGGGSCVDTTTGDKLLTCDTGSLDPTGFRKFVYSANMPSLLSGQTGGGKCSSTQYLVQNTATLVGVTVPAAGQDVCINAAPDFSISKSASTTSAKPGDIVTYTITVTNSGTAAGSTSFTDTYDPRLTPSAVTISGTGGPCVTDTTAHTISCKTGTINGGNTNNTQTFSYTAMLPSQFSGQSGGENCATGTFPVKNSAALDAGGDPSVIVVCVAAAPKFTIDKTVNPTTATPNQEVTYTIVVTNSGNAADSTSFVDSYDPRLTPSAVTISGTGGPCVTDTTAHTITCTTGTIAGGNATQTFSYKAKMPASFTGDTAKDGCSDTQYSVKNTATLDVTAGGGSDDAVVCVNASPTFTIVKTADTNTTTANGMVKYTIVVTNSGTASGSTSFVDSYDPRLTPSAVTISGTGGPCVTDTTAHTISCKTGTIAPLGGTQTFSYTVTMPASFTGNPGSPNNTPCTSDPPQYPVINTVTLDKGPSDGETVCVNAAPDFRIAKSAAPNPVNPGDQVTYTVTVSNVGTASGSTKYVDTYDPRLTPSAVTISGTGGPCVTDTTAHTITCMTGVIAPLTGTQTFTYTANVPSTFSGPAGGTGPDGVPCSARNPQRYPVYNSVVLANGRSANATVCVNAAPVASVTKSAQVQGTTDGGQVIVYTIGFQNTGAAASTTTAITDTIPTGTQFVSCGGCTPVGSPTVTSVRWDVGSTPAKTAGTSVTFTVLVTATQQCSISNTAYVQFDDYSPVASNTTVTPISPVANPAGAHASGQAIGAQVTSTGLLAINTAPISYAASSKSGPGNPTFGYDNVLGLSVPGSGKVLRAGVLTTTSASGVFSTPPMARQISSSEVAGVCILPISGLCTVEADVVRGVASTIATGQYAAYGSQGSTITNLKVLGIVTPVDLNQTTTIALPASVFGSGSYVAIGERAGSAGLVGSSYVADLTVTMLHVKVTNLLGLQKINVIVGQATAHSDFPKLLDCVGINRTVSGHAFVAQLTTSPQLVDLTQGLVGIPPTGGDESQHIAAINVSLAGKAVVAAATGDTHSFSAFTATQVYSQSSAELAGNTNTPACVIQLPTMCVVTAVAVHTQSQTLATAAGVTSTDNGTTLVGVRVLGIPIAANVAPNTTIALPGIGYLVLNEQFCDNGAPAFHTCTGAKHSGLTVRALDLVINGLSNPSGLPPAIQLIVAESHSDATFIS